MYMQLRGTFEGVLPGRYRVQWRMKLSLAARWNEPLDFTVNLANVSRQYPPLLFIGSNWYLEQGSAYHMYDTARILQQKRCRDRFLDCCYASLRDSD